MNNRKVGKVRTGIRQPDPQVMKAARRRIEQTVKTTTTQTAHFFQDVTRFADKHYVIAKSGEFLYKSVKRRVGQFIFFAATCFIGGKAVTGQEVHLSQVGALAAIAGLVAYGFQWWANRVLHKHIDYAQSHGANLLEDRKKAHFIGQLGNLWEAVYAPESSVLFSEAHRRKAAAEIARIKKAVCEKHWQKILPAQNPCDIKEIIRFDLGYILSNSDERYALLDKEGFCAAVEYELRTFHPQSVQAKRLGFSIAQLEDLLDGATLTRNDTKIFEQRAHSSLQEIAVCVADQLPFWGYATWQIHQAWLRYCQAFWQYNIALSIEASVGSLLYRLHNKYETGMIDAQDIIWQDKESLDCLQHQLGGKAPTIVDEIKSEARKIIRKIFSHHKNHARRLVIRMYGYNVLHGINLLMAYDHQYATNKLNHSPIDDMQIIITIHKKLEETSRIMRVAEKTMRLFHEYTHVNHNILQFYNGEEKRAIETAYYTNYKGLRQKIFSTTSCQQANSAVEVLFEEIAEQKSIFTHRLRTLRLHKELAILELEDVMEHIQYLGEL